MKKELTILQAAIMQAIKTRIKTDIEQDADSFGLFAAMKRLTFIRMERYENGATEHHTETAYKDDRDAYVTLTRYRVETRYGKYQRAFWQINIYSNGEMSVYYDGMHQRMH